MTALVGPADLLRVAAALRAADSDIVNGLAEAARAFGYAPLPSRAQATPGLSELVAGRPVGREPSPELAEPASVPFWQPIAFAWHDDSFGSEPPRRVDADVTAEAREQQARTARKPPRPAPLAPRSHVVPRLQRAVQTGLRGCGLDVAALVRAWARGVAVRRLPRTQRRSWPAFVLLLDRSFHLVPFWRDQLDVRAWLRGLVGRAAVVVRFVDGAGPDGLVFDEQGKPVPLPDGTLTGLPVLALTDLGWYGGPSLALAWLRLGRRLQRAGERLLAFVPVPPSRWTPTLARVWTPLAWERPNPDLPRSAAELAARVDRLLDLAADTRRLEPGLLRALRLLLPRAAADVGTEADAWMHEDLAGMAADATVLRPDRAASRRSRFAREAPELRARVATALRTWHWHRERRPELWHAEALLLAASGRAAVADAAERAEAFMARLARSAGELPARAAALRRWLDATSRSAPTLFDRKTAAGRSLQRAWAVTHPPEDPPPDADPRLLSAPGDEHREPCPYELRHVGDALELRPLGTKDPITNGGSRVGLLWASAPFVYPIGAGTSPSRVSLATPARIPCDPTAPLELRTDRATVTLQVARRPAWGVYDSEFGRDRDGLWFAVRVGPVALTLRWIPPGYCRMADPAGHPNREPQHDIVIQRGFWLGKTPVTQALWTAVMGTNPSRNQHPDRPVEGVTREQAQQFAERLDGLLPGRDGGRFRLPSEAEWEYACRAGQAVADMRRSEPSPPNHWGLQDMLSEVREWCNDDRRDPDAPGASTGHRGIVRGGADLPVNESRMAIRRRLDPRYADGDVGFRIARDQGPLNPRSAAQDDP